MAGALPDTVVELPVRRVRTSATAIRETLKAIQDMGLSVDRVCVIGGQVEIHCGSIEHHPAPEKDGGLKDW